ncbi:membrAne [Seminavis robusta]|uniref:MembrAne n=1 Tax=Seminavis robusta TaxID=568900 RepID=A0A9N8HNZ0_9STRA|nr:membrAne [Seminavis robusta]|eukprot:Sro1037_g234140.1 membrAne (443) ;mRNA; f:17353-18681
MMEEPSQHPMADAGTKHQSETFQQDKADTMDQKVEPAPQVVTKVSRRRSSSRRMTSQDWFSSRSFHDDGDSSSSEEDDDDDLSLDLPAFKTKSTENHQPANSGGKKKPQGQEYIYAICVGVLLSFNAGYVNGSCLTGLVAPSGTMRAVTSHTGTLTKSALALASGNFKEFGFLLSMFLCFGMGSFIAGALTPKPRPFIIEPSYGPTFLLGGIFLTTSSTLAALEVRNENFIFYFAAAANGIQNGISSLYSQNLIRSTGITGTTTDIGIFTGQLLRGNCANTWKIGVLLSLWSSFWCGGLVSFFATSSLLHFSLLFNAGLFLIIGASVIVFLTHNMSLSVTGALLGNFWGARTSTSETSIEKCEEPEPASAGSSKTVDTDHNQTGGATSTQRKIVPQETSGPKDMVKSMKEADAEKKLSYTDHTTTTTGYMDNSDHSMTDHHC